MFTWFFLFVAYRAQPSYIIAFLYPVLTLSSHIAILVPLLYIPQLGDVFSTSRILLDLSFGIRNVITSIIGTAIILQIVPSQLVASLLAPIVGVFVFGLAQGR